MRYPIPLYRALTVLCLACGVLSLQAKVFRGTGKAQDELLNGNLPWEAATRTSMTVNGRPAMVHVYAARYSEPVVEQLRGRFEALGAEVKLARSAAGATGIAKWPDREASFIVLAPQGSPHKHIVVYYPKGGAAKKVRFPVPEYARGQTATTISDDDTGTFLATIQTADSAADIHAFYARCLSEEGWTMVGPPAVGNGVVRGLAAYRKKNKVCYVQVSERPGEANMITLLVKDGAL